MPTVAKLGNASRTAIKTGPIGEHEMNTTFDTGNNEQISIGIYKNNDGTYTAMTFTKSKDFKTLKGAQKWMSQ